MAGAALAMSKSQHGGRADTSRNCQPELKLCNTAVFFEWKNTPMMLRLTEDIDGRVVARDICSFNSFGDVRTCVDWDSGKSSRQMKDTNGEWYAVDD
ncbi:MAG: hypothetical protein J0H54_08675 [Rhizobiales bacterium]|nr:hypothetical protein [Hyphomicrobiales bacterium]